MTKKPYSADWGWGLLAGMCFGAIGATLLLDPEHVTGAISSQTRWYIAVGFAVAGSVVTALRNWFWKRGQPRQDNESTHN